MSFPQQPPYQQPPAAVPPPPKAYRASTRSRVVVWTIAVVLAGALAATIGGAIYRAASDSARENKLVAACEQEALRRLRPADASAAAFTPAEVTKLPDDRAHVAAAVRLADVRTPFTCEGRWDGSRWTIIELQFS